MESEKEMRIEKEAARDKRKRENNEGTIQADPIPALNEKYSRKQRK